VWEYTSLSVHCGQIVRGAYWEEDPQKGGGRSCGEENALGKADCSRQGEVMFLCLKDRDVWLHGKSGERREGKAISEREVRPEKEDEQPGNRKKGGRGVGLRSD